MPENFNDYLKGYQKSLKQLFQDQSFQDNTDHKRGIPSSIMDQISTLSPSSVSIPESFGGRGSHPSEILSLLECTSYESLPLSLILGINGALFLEPLAKYGHETAKEETFKKFIENHSLGGLMITEPDHGTDALAMKTSWQKSDRGYTIEGQKHWAGLSGRADYWLMTAREKKSGTELKRDIDFFICDTSDPRQYVKPVEEFSNLGLYMIPYALNQVDVEVPSHHRLVPVKSGIRLMQDLLHRSRMRFPGMASGFIHRMLDEAVKHTQERFVSGKALNSYDQVQKRLSDLQADYTIASAFCRHSAGISSIENDLSGRSLEANIHKTVLSDMMQNASQSLLQLVGAKGYKLNHIAGRSVVDSRPFQIFEGSNDVIYQQVADQFIKHMNLMKEFDLYRALNTHPLTGKIADRLRKITNLSINPNMIQRKKVELGKILGRITSLEWTLDLEIAGYDPSLIKQALDSMTERIQALLGSFHGMNQSSYIPVALNRTAAWQDTLL
ncbi:MULTISPECIES: acyl-CoA dehydrogenase family protein [unclassified Oceanispirochaeta]|uniref:acyl-CoA dehydrogenase family protein n=1 Tax=unclassified Oceanispirochaeta TaxID=2635722 RepID=UPI000E09C17F|nr:MULTISPECIES: acyl-CoA dehydrogenase family protein [unclassified Oceanispirochaeta]MBF9017504.1 acyl-CoA/acyl-ACP dehydrogenase [Oceanispirochaeta sp. M2]NPD74076.1 acyl-CoA/acyl-ACP dehydrogenase [Oceanispirochaeta sp. M1]RDG30117.1 acyl-CoA dehydrogenase [Oceanispirochaeta sp. M1]